MTLGNLLSEKAKKNGSKPYLYYEEEVIGFDRLNSQAERMGHALTALGVSQGQHVALLLTNCPAYLYCWYGLAKIGAVCIALNTQYKQEMLQSVLQAADTDFVVLADDFDEKEVFALADSMGIKALALKHLESLAERKPNAGEASAEYEKQGLASEGRDFDDTAPLIMTQTSGTTGMPKLVLNTHRAYITAAQDLAEYTGMTGEDIIYSSLPLYHANPQVYCALNALVSDASIVIEKKFSASQFWVRAAQYKATSFSYVGAILPILLQQPTDNDGHAANVSKCFGGGAPREIYEAVEKRFGVEVLELYGMSETGAWNTINKPGRGRAGTVGELRHGFDIRIFDEKDNEIPRGQVGEIVIRPMKPYIMFNGYYKQPDETLECSSNWWFHTGDLGKVDGEGYYYFCGRKKETIRRGGENISPQEIQKVICKHQAVVECVVVGVDDLILGEEIKAYIVTKELTNNLYEEIATICEGKLPSFMVPRYMEIVTKIPRTGSEKIQLGVLKEMGVNENTWDRVKERQAGNA